MSNRPTIVRIGRRGGARRLAAAWPPSRPTLGTTPEPPTPRARAPARPEATAAPARAPRSSTCPSPLIVPDTPVVDQDGKPVRFYTDLVKGRVVAINFIFTTCQGVCPPMGTTFSKLAADLKGPGRPPDLGQRRPGQRHARPARGLGQEVRGGPGLDARHRREAGRRRPAPVARSLQRRQGQPLAVHPPRRRPQGDLAEDSRPVAARGDPRRHRGDDRTAQASADSTRARIARPSLLHRRPAGEPARRDRPALQRPDPRQGRGDPRLLLGAARTPAR